MPLSSVVGAQSIVKPGVCTSSTRPASPYDGQVIYETDTDAVKVWDGSAWVGATNAASLNGVGQSVAFTPTFGNFTLGNGTVTASYVLVNKLCFMTVKVTLGSTSSVTGAITVSLPVTAASSILYGSNAVINDTGTANYVGFVYQGSTTGLVLALQNVASTYPQRANTSATVPMTWAINDTFNITHTFEVA
jgi:hypothetical protein